jgi:hypothetical protein
MADPAQNPAQKAALYYPYIHIRSEHWLKATLLYAPVVKRIVPADYAPEDQPNIRKYTNIKGPDGELLQPVPAYSPAADLAQQNLRAKIEKNLKTIKRKFGQSRAPVPDEYWIHDAKFNGNLLAYLAEHQLAWSSQDPHGQGHRKWFALHPVLGSAVMTTLGLGIAGEKHYDIVTNSDAFHETLLATNEDQIFDTLLRSGAEPKAIIGKTQARRDLGQLVITLTGVNYEALRPEDIPELQASDHFQEFRKLIRARASSIDVEEDSSEYPGRLESEAQDIVDAWHATRGSLSKGLRDALFAEGCALTVDALKQHLKHVSPTATDLAVAGGVAVGRILLKGWQARKAQRQGPYAYLTKIVEVQNRFLQMSFPLGLER